MPNTRKITDQQVAEIRREAKSDGSNWQELADRHGVSRRYVGQLLRNERRSSVGEAILMETEPDPKVEQMSNFYSQAITAAVEEYINDIDLTPLHTGVINMMSSVYRMTPEEVEHALYDKINDITLNVSIGE